MHTITDAASLNSESLSLMSIEPIDLASSPTYSGNSKPSDILVDFQ